ncbi:conserved hypothetical protein [Ricinus communis]|uniref:Uncharacterized protein n=1 Tax=Ricinus communis TaxID=3988 RepID=B9RL13_RICCO|nr:conserved hypothetical protein [Ricinus communis]
MAPGSSSKAMTSTAPSVFGDGVSNTSAAPSAAAQGFDFGVSSSSNPIPHSVGFVPPSNIFATPPEGSITNGSHQSLFSSSSSNAYLVQAAQPIT